MVVRHAAMLKNMLPHTRLLGVGVFYVCSRTAIFHQ